MPVIGIAQSGPGRATATGYVIHVPHVAPRPRSLTSLKYRTSRQVRDGPNRISTHCKKSSRGKLNVFYAADIHRRRINNRHIEHTHVRGAFPFSICHAARLKPGGVDLRQRFFFAKRQIGREHTVEDAPSLGTQIDFRRFARLVGCEVVVEMLGRQRPQLVAKTVSPRLGLFWVITARSNPRSWLARLLA